MTASPAPRTGAAGDPVLSQRSLNRALLTRQLLLRRDSRSVPETIEHLVGMQAQSPSNPYLALWSRLQGFEADQLSRMIADRKAVRATLMRATIHLTTSEDYLALRPVMQSVPAQTFRSSHFARNVAGVDLDEVVGFGQRFFRGHLRPLPLLSQECLELLRCPRLLPAIQRN